MSARKQRKLDSGSSSSDRQTDNSEGDSEGEEGEVSKACSFQRKKSSQHGLSPTHSNDCTQSAMNLQHARSDCDLVARTSGVNKIVHSERPKEATPSSTSAKHRITVYLGRRVPYIGGKLKPFTPAQEQPVNKLSSSKLVVACPCGDSWVSRHPDVRRGRLFRTNNKRYDSVIKAFESGMYAFQDLLHAGHFSIVLLGYSRERARHEVLKISKLDQTLRDPSQNLRRGHHIHKRMHHKNITELVGQITLKGFYCIFLEYCEAGSLEHLLKRSPGNLIPEPVARQFFHGMISGLEYLHRHGIVHLNLNAKNLLITHDKHLKLSDFEYADYYSPGDPYPGCFENINVRGHLPPEVFAAYADGLITRFNPRKADIWASGVVLFQLVTGKLPFKTEQSWPSLELSEKAGIVDAFDMTPIHFSMHLRDLLTNIVNPDPNTRANMPFIKSHAFYKRPTGAAKGRVYISNFQHVHPARKKAIGAKMEKRMHEHGI